jgi:hypothetical protein
MNEILQQLIWPIVVIILVIIFLIIFRRAIANRIEHVILVKGKGWEVHMDTNKDKLTILSPKVSESIPQVIEPETIQSTSTIGKPTIIVGEPKLSEEEIEKSKLKAQQRINEDTKRVGYQRGKLWQLADGSYGVAWEIKSAVDIGIRANIESD